MSKLDRTGLLLSALCVLHCAALPLAVLLLPATASLLRDHSSLLHWLLLLLAVPVSGFALWVGARRVRRAGPLLLGLSGLLAMTLGVSHVLDAGLEVPLTLLGSIAVAVAHLFNLRALRPA